MRYRTNHLCTVLYPGTFTTQDDPRINPGYRLQIEHDSDAESPLEWGDHITTESDEYKEYVAGRVYGVTVEREETYTNDRTGDKRIEWDAVAYRGGNYFDRVYDGVLVANEIAPEAVTP